MTSNRLSSRQGLYGGAGLPHQIEAAPVSVIVYICVYIIRESV